MEWFRSRRIDRAKMLGRVAFCAAILLSVRVFLGILYEFRYYFPADFDHSAYLAGRRYTFEGVFRIAFYTHILTSPLSLLLGTGLIWSGHSRATQNNRVRLRWHRRVGKLHAMLVLLCVVPSGCVMATQAYSGPVAGMGFGVWGAATALTMCIAVGRARTRQIESHRLWSSRCYLLLWSPLLQRVLAGITHVLQIESEFTYQGTAWVSWLLPWSIFEYQYRRIKPGRSVAFAMTGEPSGLLSGLHGSNETKGGKSCRE